MYTIIPAVKKRRLLVNNANIYTVGDNSFDEGEHFRALKRTASVQSHKIVLVPANLLIYIGK